MAPVRPRPESESTARWPEGSGTMSENETAEQSLYQRLGGYDGVAAASDDFLARLQSDPRLKDYWKGSSLEVRRRGRHLVVDFMVEAAGGPAYYTGRDM